MTIDIIKLALDKASTVRSVNDFGFLKVVISPISKATVNPYRGAEIPNWQSLGLDPDRIYFLLRDPAELLRAVKTFNNVPILSRHVPVFADNPPKELIVGATGTDAAWNAPYINNSLTIWDAEAIKGIETREAVELSSAYLYDADMTPGMYEGVRYDGVMRNIRGNHVALVEAGRAGPDVVVGDSQLSTKKVIIVPTSKKLTAKAIAVRAALSAYLKPRIAQDAKLTELTPILAGVTSATFAKEKTAIGEKIRAVFKPRLAQDASLDDLTDMLDQLDDPADDADLGLDDDGMADDATPGAQLSTLLQSAGLSPDVMTQVQAILAKLSPGADATVPPAVKPAVPAAAPAAGPGTAPPNAVSKPAMDAALVQMRNDTIAQMRAIQTAEREIEALKLGAFVAQDSAEAVYKLALDSLKVDVTGVHPSAYRALVQSELRHRSARKNDGPVLVAMDGAQVSDFHKRFPNASK